MHTTDKVAEILVNYFSKKKSINKQMMSRIKLNNGKVRKFLT